MHKSVADLAIKYGIPIGRLSSGHYVVRDNDRKIIYMSYKPTAQSGVAMLRKLASYRDYLELIYGI